MNDSLFEVKGADQSETSAFTNRFPLAYYINISRRDDRRDAVQAQLCEHNLSISRFPAIDKHWVKDARGMASKARYACGLAKRLVIRRAKLARAKAVMIFEDDIMFHPDFHERIEKLQLPDDWGLLYLGCLHAVRPVPVAEGLVRIRCGFDNHAWAVREEWYNEVLRICRPYGKGSDACLPASDVMIAALQGKIPSYAAFPNLVWQKASHSDNLGRFHGNYDEKGNQTLRGDVVWGLEWEILFKYKYGLTAAHCVKLFFGAVDETPDEWLNISDKVEITRSLPFTDESISDFYFSNKLAMITHRQAAALFKEVRRTLVPGGTVVISELHVSQPDLLSQRSGRALNGIWASRVSLWTVSLIEMLIIDAGFEIVSASEGEKLIVSARYEA